MNANRAVFVGLVTGLGLFLALVVALSVSGVFAQ